MISRTVLRCIESFTGNPDNMTNNRLCTSQIFFFFFFGGGGGGGLISPFTMMLQKMSENNILTANRGKTRGRKLIRKKGNKRIYNPD